MFSNLHKNFFVIFVFFTVLVLLVFREGWIGIPRADQYCVLAERNIAPSDFSFFWKMLSFNRTRLFLPGDYGLFRPGMTGLLAIGDIFFRDHFVLVGVASLLCHALAATALYFLIGEFAGFLVAFWVATLFSFQYSGSLLIFWRHVCPYLFSVIFFAVAIILLARTPDSTKKRKDLWPAFFFFVAGLFHETVPVLLSIAGSVLFAFSFWRPRPFSFSRREIAGLFLLPALVFWGLDFVDIWIYQPQSLLFGSADHPERLGIFVVLNTALRSVGLFLFVYLLPAWVHLIPHNRDYLRFIEWWDFTVFSLEFFYWVGILGCGVGLFFLRKTVARLPSGPRRLALWLVLGFFAVLVGGLSAGRVAARGWWYLAFSPYYYYLTNFTLSVLVAFLARFLIVGKGRRVVAARVLLGGLVCWQIGNNYLGIRDFIGLNLSHEKKLLEISRRSRALLGGDRYCYAASLSPNFSQTYPDSLFLPLACARKRGEPVYLIDRPGEGKYLARLRTEPPRRKGVLRADVLDDRFLVPLPAEKGIPLMSNGTPVPPDMFIPLLRLVDEPGGGEK